MKRARSHHNPFFKRGWVLATSISIILVIVGVFVAAASWDWLSEQPAMAVSNGENARNVGFLIAGVLALVFAVWRAIVAERQANASRTQAATAQEGQLNDQYQRGAEMLGSGVLAVRLGGIYALQRLAEENTDLYHIQIMRLFCAFAKNPTDTETANIWEERRGAGLTTWPRLRADLQAIVSFIGDRSAAARTIEQSAEFTVDLSETRLNGVDMAGMDMTGVRFFETELIDADMTDTILVGAELTGANLHKAVIEDADCSHVKLFRATLTQCSVGDTNFLGAQLGLADCSRAELMDCNFSGANLGNANLYQANFEGSIFSGTQFNALAWPKTLEEQVGVSALAHITQRQLDQATAAFNNPPQIPPGTVDPETGKELVWHGRVPENCNFWA